MCNVNSTRESAESSPRGDGVLTSLLLGLGSLSRDWRPGSLPRQPLCLETLPVCVECFLSDLVLSHCLFGLDLAKCVTRFALHFGDRLMWSKFARCLCHVIRRVLFPSSAIAAS